MCKTYIVQNNQMIGPSALLGANRVKDAMMIDCRQQLLNKQHQKDATDGCEVEVVDHKQPIQLERRTLAHQLPAAENNHIVCRDGQKTLLHRRHGRNTRLKVEVLGMITLQRREDLVEDRPQVDAEWAINGRNWQRLHDGGHDFRSGRNMVMSSRGCGLSTDTSGVGIGGS